MISTWSAGDRGEWDGGDVRFHTTGPQPPGLGRRSFLAGLALALAVGALSGCSDTPTESGDGGAPTESGDGGAPAEPGDSEESGEVAPASVWPEPSGPVVSVTRTPYPFTIQGIGWQTFPQVFGEPASAGYVYLVIALRFRPTLTDRDSKPPSPFEFGVQWGPGEGAWTVDFFTGYMATDAVTFDDPRTLGADGSMPPGSEYNLVLKALVPEDVDPSSVSVDYLAGRDAIPLSALPELPWS